MSDFSRKKFLESCFWVTLPFPLIQMTPFLQKIQGNSKEMRQNNTNVNSQFIPSYIRLHLSGELKKRGEQLWEMMKSCHLCPRACAVDRISGEEGFCGASARLEIASFHPHFGEEQPLVGRGGSGTIFFTNCGLRCVFCINYDISQEGAGDKRSIEQLAGMMLRLQEIGCHNINVVTPTHYSAHIIKALDMAAEDGLRLPLVYNTCGWEEPSILKILDGIVDIYLPDFKYFDAVSAEKYSSGAYKYPEITQQALLEMHRQVGVAKPAPDGLMYRGLMIRHLVMPGSTIGSKQVMKWIAENLPKDTYVNIMSQYRPMYKAFEYPEIARRITRKEYSDVIETAQSAGLTNLDIQGVPF